MILRKGGENMIWWIIGIIGFVFLVVADLFDL